MSTIARTTQVNEQGYKEVSLDYRIARAAMLDAKDTSAQTGRIVCPMLDASRRKHFYGEMALQDTDSKSIEKWSDALELDDRLVKGIAYSSGSLSSAAKNVIQGRFDDQAVNDGFIHQLKNGIDTGILGAGSFNQAQLNAFVWSFQPKLEGIAMTNDWLYSEKGAAVYLDETALPAVMAHNKKNAKSDKVKRGLKLSEFEMEQLLIGVLGQSITLDSNNPEKQTNAISIRDVHDLYKYGIMPAHIEEHMQAAGLLGLPEVYT